MKKIGFFLFMTFLAISLFAQNTNDYNRILNRNLSAFAGYWVNGDGDRYYLQPDGGRGAGNFSRYENIYRWNVWIEGEGGFAVVLFPIGVDVVGYDYSTDTQVIIKTDKTKVRLFMGQDGPSNSESI